MARYVVKEITRKEVEVLIALGIGGTDGWCRSFVTSPLIVGTAIPQWPQKEMHIYKDYRFCWLFEKVGDNNYEES